MHKHTKSIITTLAALAIAVPAVYAASVHFKGGNPQFTDNGTTLKTCFSLAGLGNQDVTITVKARGTASTICRNPGGNVAPGQNKFPVRTFAEETIPSTEIKNGNVSVCLTTNEPADPTAREAGCPNGNWDAEITDVHFSSVEVIVEQGGKVVLDKTFNR